MFELKKVNDADGDFKDNLGGAKATEISLLTRTKSEGPKPCEDVIVTDTVPSMSAFAQISALVDGCAPGPPTLVAALGSRSRTASTLRENPLDVFLSMVLPAAMVALSRRHEGHHACNSSPAWNMRMWNAMPRGSGSPTCASDPAI